MPFHLPYTLRMVIMRTDIGTILVQMELKRRRKFTPTYDNTMSDFPGLGTCTDRIILIEDQISYIHPLGLPIPHPKQVFLILGITKCQLHRGIRNWSVLGIYTFLR